MEPYIDAEAKYKHATYMCVQPVAFPEDKFSQEKRLLPKIKIRDSLYSTTHGYSISEYKLEA